MPEVSDLDEGDGGRGRVRFVRGPVGRLGDAWETRCEDDREGGSEEDWEGGVDGTLCTLGDPPEDEGRGGTTGGRATVEYAGDGTVPIDAVVVYEGVLSCRCILPGLNEVGGCAAAIASCRAAATRGGRKSEMSTVEFAGTVVM